MDQKIIDELKEKLISESELIKRELAEVSSPDRGDHVPGDYAPKYPNYGDDAHEENTASPQESAEFGENVDITYKLEKKLDEIEKALEKIENNEYGVCEKCKKEISHERLLANPAASCCVDCVISD